MNRRTLLALGGLALTLLKHWPAHANALKHPHCHAAHAAARTDLPARRLQGHRSRHAPDPVPARFRASAAPTSPWSRPGAQLKHLPTRTRHSPSSCSRPSYPTAKPGMRSRSRPCSTPRLKNTMWTAAGST
ncbi:hypothetical protein LP419_14860 [Massilia sp. H-1]|nr:hypothetical protein LP419_14860 [Massilia sp. H-1]